MRVRARARPPNYGVDPGVSVRASLRLAGLGHGSGFHPCTAGPHFNVEVVRCPGHGGPAKDRARAFWLPRCRASVARAGFEPSDLLVMSQARCRAALPRTTDINGGRGQPAGDANQVWYCGAAAPLAALNLAANFSPTRTYLRFFNAAVRVCRTVGNDQDCPPVIAE